MRIVVIGGTGLIGTWMVRILRAGGHDVAAHSLSTGLDLRSEKGLPQALNGADVVVNLTNSPTYDRAAPVFFRETTENLLLAAEDAEVGHLVTLSVVGAERVPRLPYFRAKVLQEDLIEAGPVPFSIMRATQTFELVEAMLPPAASGPTVRLPATALQPLAAKEVAWMLATVSAGEPLEGIRDVAGPEVLTLAEVAQATLSARGDNRTVVTGGDAGLFAAVPGDELLADAGATIAPTTLEQWLGR
ncbi:SDR family oxidoreductase [Actinoplanes hulinensis]|uniref:SDR family oxidoreductase n=2 Tax=Actinoplanes hulinensis TaxID=1144547 RepID=A0ABS7BE12_9ACTN|nr:SDR family oxidoreductase [Actinoplanes hulinensis]